jgi:hypothetical protein
LSLHTELKTLFGKATIRQSKQLEPDQVDALAVKEAAGALLRLKGQPLEQAALVSEMQPNTAAALCRWIVDPEFWGVVGSISKH